MSGSDGLSFPDLPRAGLEEALSSLLDHGERVMRTQSRLRALLHANQLVVEQIDLPRVLRRVVEAATELVDAQYGAMGVLTPERDALEQFIYVGMTDEEATAIGHLPEGHGLLGALITDPHPIRLTEMSADPRAAGFPPRHPPMGTFLGVPVRVRGEVFGNLYLTNRRSGTFSEEDEQLVAALAATAGFAIDNARLFADSRTRERWASAAGELTSAILSTPTEMALDLIASRILEVSGAARVSVLLAGSDAEGHQVAAVRGDDETALRGRVLHPPLLATTAIDTLAPQAVTRLREPTDDPLLVHAGGQTGAALAVPLRSRTRLWGAVVIARDPDEARFSAAEIDSAGDLASRASVALELAHAREDAQRALLADDRRRIARDLHDHVIQQLFGTGLALQAVASGLGPGPEAQTIGDAIDQLDDAITQIRTVVFALSHRDESSVRHRLLDVVGSLSALGRRPPSIRFTGPVDHLIRDGLATDVVAVARELLSNAIRHAAADHVSVEVSAHDGSVTVTVTDDGIGIPADAVRRGLTNLRERAESRSGTLVVTTSDAGTSAAWTVPVPPSPSPAPAEGVS